MPSAAPTLVLSEPPLPLPQQLAEIIRPELPSLHEEIVQAVRRAIPEYAQSPHGPYGKAMRLGVEHALGAFTARVESSGEAAREQLAEVHRRLGRFEAQEGRSLDTLLTAYRLGARIAWRRAMQVGRHYDLSSDVMTAFADMLFAYVDELSELAREGYLQARAESAEQIAGLRRRLLRLLLSDDGTVPRGVLADLAAQAAWPLPESVTPVAVAGPARAEPAALGDDVLADFGGAQPQLLVPGECGPERAETLSAALGGAPAAIGLTVPLHGAADSLRWARRLLALREDGLVDGDPLRCADHLVSLWLLADPALLDQIAERELAPLRGVSGARHEKLAETLRLWLTTHGTSERLGELLRVHPQTVRYRRRMLEQLFGDRLADPDRRFALEAVLRALRLRYGAGRAGRP